MIRTSCVELAPAQWLFYRAVMRRRVIQISRSHRQLNIERSDVNDEAAYRFEREFLEIRLRRKALPLAHQAGHQLAVIYFSLFFVPTHIGSGFESATVIQSGNRAIGQSGNQAIRNSSNFKPFL